MVLRALQWLKHHNKYYNSIDIDHAALSQLPTDGDLTGLNTMEDITTDDEVEKPTDDQEPHDIATFVPAAARKMTEQEVVRKSIVDDRRPTTVPWPSKGDAPINEFTTEGYMSCVFPKLLPTGAGDFVASRQRSFTIGNYFKHLMMYGEGQFAKHPRFRYFEH